MYVEQEIKDSKGNTHTILTFGPVSVLPKFQNKGIGSQLINHTISLAKEMGYKAILIYGDPEYYKRFGFKVSKEYGITNKDGKYPVALLALELYQNALDGISGIFDESEVYAVDAAELKAFDAKFPRKEKAETESQARFAELAGMFL